MLCLCCEFGFLWSRYLYIVLGGYLRILGAPTDPVFNPVAPYQYLLSNLYLFMADITNPDLVV